MNDLEKAKALLQSGEYTCVLAKAGVVYTSGKKGIAPLMDLLAENTDLRGFSAADKIVGKAAAMLFAHMGVGEVFSEVMSEPAVSILSKYGIAHSFDTLTAYIVNRAGDGVCPMEQAVKGIEVPSEAYTALKEALARLTLPK